MEKLHFLSFHVYNKKSIIHPSLGQSGLQSLIFKFTWKIPNFGDANFHFPNIVGIVGGIFIISQIHMSGVWNIFLPIK